MRKRKEGREGGKRIERRVRSMERGGGEIPRAVILKVFCMASLPRFKLKATSQTSE